MRCSKLMEWEKKHSSPSHLHLFSTSFSGPAAHAFQGGIYKACSLSHLQVSLAPALQKVVGIQELFISVLQFQCWIHPCISISFWFELRLVVSSYSYLCSDIKFSSVWIQTINPRTECVTVLSAAKLQTSLGEKYSECFSLILVQ
jgi:hypothetical protein